MGSTTNIKCFLAFVATLALVAIRFWPIGLVLGIAPAVAIWHFTRFCLGQSVILDEMVEEFIRRAGGDF